MNNSNSGTNDTPNPEPTYVSEGAALASISVLLDTAGDNLSISVMRKYIRFDPSS